MEEKLCFCCEINPATENHHIIPKSLGGKKTIPVCSSCHAKIHCMKDGQKTRRDNHSFLTKKGLERARKRGVKIGCPGNLTNAGRKKGRLTRSKKARTNKANIKATKFILLHIEKGYTITQIARKLNDQGYKTSRGKGFVHTTVRRLLDRALSE